MNNNYRICYCPFFSREKQHWHPFPRLTPDPQCRPAAVRNGRRFEPEGRRFPTHACPPAAWRAASSRCSSGSVSRGGCGLVYTTPTSSPTLGAVSLWSPERLRPNYHTENKKVPPPPGKKMSPRQLYFSGNLVSQTGLLKYNPTLFAQAPGQNGPLAQEMEVFISLVPSLSPQKVWCQNLPGGMLCGEPLLIITHNNRAHNTINDHSDSILGAF